MTENVCLAVGVGDAPPLDYLAGAVNGARAIAKWARAQGYETRLLTDEEDPVGIDEIKSALEELLAAAPKKLLLYFAGHGFLSGGGLGDDIWLLSEWRKTGIGVSVTLLTRQRLHLFGLKRLILISDACRTLANEMTSFVNGQAVLGMGPFPYELPQSDSYFASSPKRAAYMVPGRNLEESRCIFSGLLTEALSGVHKEAFTEENRKKPITNYSLANFLEKNVPKWADHYGVTLKPTSITSIRPPDNVYLERCPEPPPPEGSWPDPNEFRVTGMESTDNDGRIAPPPGLSWSTKKDRELLMPAETTGTRAPTLTEVDAKDDKAISEAQKVIKARRRLAMDAIQVDAANRPNHFETGAGFTIDGAQAAGAFVGARGVAKNLFANAWRIEPGYSVSADEWWSHSGMIKSPMPLVVKLSDGRFAGSAVLPNFVLTFTFDDIGSQAVIYRRMGEPFSEDAEETLAQLRATGLSATDAPEVAQRLRYSKHADPTLGVLAAWLHDAVGDIANIHRTAFFYAERGEPIPFDIALLGRLPARRDAKGVVHLQIPATEEAAHRHGEPGYMWRSTPATEGILAGAFPWMRQGWSRLHPDGQTDLYPRGLSELSDHLLPAPFTSLDRTGGTALVELLFREG
ncbi:MAG: caspase family protein [Anaerolineales bacterium]|nr:caspase family protein [Anaerolineales bacterium]